MSRIRDWSLLRLNGENNQIKNWDKRFVHISEWTVISRFSQCVVMSVIFKMQKRLAFI